jgi:peptidoglycan/LPS O-acetylase OafA/YrhL
MKRFRSHATVLGVIALAVIVILLTHSIRVRLEWGTGGFILGLLAGAFVAIDGRHHRKKARSQSPPVE